MEVVGGIGETGYVLFLIRWFLIGVEDLEIRGFEDDFGIVQIWLCMYELWFSAWGFPVVELVAAQKMHLYTSKQGRDGHGENRRGETNNLAEAREWYLYGSRQLRWSREVTTKNDPDRRSRQLLPSLHFPTRRLGMISA